MVLLIPDLNNDGYLTYNDFLWAKDKICYMSGWKIDNPKYKITEALFKEIWDSLEEIAEAEASLGPELVRDTLRDVLSGKAVFEEACHSTKVPNLTFMPAGNRNASPLELLADERFAKLIREAREKFDRVILDSAPINAVSDALLIVKQRF